MRKRNRGAAAGIAVSAVGLALILLALAMSQDWVDRHFLPTWGYDWPVQLRIIAALRASLAMLGIAILLLASPWAARAAGAGRGGEALGAALRIALAVIAAFVAAEAILQFRTWHSIQDRQTSREPLRVADAELGWTFAPNQRRDADVNGRIVHYATGPQGYRTERPGDVAAFDRPTIVIGGESILFGYGLQWRETIGARLQALTGIQAATIAVDAYGTDQALMRLRRELPRFSHPVAVILPFLPRLLDRNLDRDRPHLDPSLRWHGGRGPSFRLVELARRAIRYRSTAAIDEGIEMTRAALAQAMRLARARGARPIILVPQYLPETDRERSIRHRVLDEAGLPYLLVPIRPAWRHLPDRHPDPRGAEAIARALLPAVAGR